MKQKTTVFTAFLIILFLVSCKENKTTKANDLPKKVTEEVEKTTKKDCNDVHWSHHEGEEGPENWKNLCDGFSDCGGKAQSPIDIITKNSVEKTDLQAPKFNYGKSKVAIINNGHTVQFNVSGDHKVNLNGKDYKLLQFHYHSLSEHTVDGKHYPIEVHFVHKNADTDFAVLGVFFEQGKENPLFKAYLNDFPITKGEFNSENMIDLIALFPKDKNYYSYSGSLTTPPCSEVVNWYVLKTALTASKAQIDQFAKILQHNFRPVQPLNGRTIGLSVN